MTALGWDRTHGQADLRILARAGLVADALGVALPIGEGVHAEGWYSVTEQWRDVLAEPLARANAVFLLSRPVTERADPSVGEEENQRTSEPTTSEVKHG